MRVIVSSSTCKWKESCIYKLIYSNKGFQYVCIYGKESIIVVKFDLPLFRFQPFYYCFFTPDIYHFSYFNHVGVIF